VSVFARCLADFRSYWPTWLPLLLVALAAPPVALFIPLVEKRLIDDVLLAGRQDLLLSSLALYGALWASSTVLQISGGLLRTRLVELLSIHVRSRLFAHCETMSVAFARREHSGRTIALFVNDAPSLVGLMTGTLMTAVSSAVTVVVGVALMFSLSWQLALVAGVAPPLIAAVASVVTRPLRPIARRVQEKAAELNERLQENLAGLREIIAYGRGGDERRRFSATLHDLMRLRMRLTYIDTTISSGQSVFALTVALVILGYGGYLVIQGQATLGTLIAMQSLFGYVFQPAGQFLGLFSNAQKAMASADRVFAFLDQQPPVQERHDARSVPTARGGITFDAVNFGYRTGQPVLHDVSLTVRPGEMIAVVGPSGAGKTTLVSMIPRFYDPDAGRILLDGEDIKNLMLDELRQHIGIVFQDTFLFAATIRENIAFGRPTASEEQIITAAQQANAWEFIQANPAGLDALVGERGARLSEGQKQRLAIARALLRDPRILILDEPTSALDARSESLLQAALDNLTRGRTTFVIAHRLATVQRADRIIVLDGGRIVDCGPHGELLQRQGLYRELFDLQFEHHDATPVLPADNGHVIVHAR
jgi:subfamily B ATP-binding cassette protein MsbA